MSTSSTYISKNIYAFFLRLKSDELSRHGFIMTIFTMLGGIFNYAFQLLMGIMLTAEQYGILFSMTSLIVILQVFSQTSTMIVSRITSNIKTTGNTQGIGALWKYSLKRSLFISLFGFLILMALSPLVARFLHLENILYPSILFTTIFFLLIISVNWGVLQGLQRFFPFGLSQAATYIARFILGALFVYIGGGISGSIAAIPLSLAVILPLTFFHLRDLTHSKDKKISIDGIGTYAGLTLLALISFALMTNVDAILARHYLVPTEAGNYSALSVLGRIVYYASLGISIAMFPKTSELYENGGNHKQLFFRALLLTVLIAGVFVLLYLLMPNSITGFLFGDKYPLVASYLFEYGASMLLLALAFVIANYFISLKRVRVAYLLLAVAILQIVLMIIYHAEISQYVHIMLTSGVLSVLVMLPLFLQKSRKGHLIPADNNVRFKQETR